MPPPDYPQIAAASLPQAGDDPSMASAPPPPSRRTTPRCSVLPPSDRLLASPSWPRARRPAVARSPPPRLADSATAPTSAKRRTAGARRPLPQPADRAAARARRRSARGGRAAQAVLPVEIWEVIFLRLDAAADLARASAACPSFRRIISERRFLRRFRSLRSPPILGYIHSSIYIPFFPVGPPHRSASEARALEQAADFGFFFLPDPRSWRFRDARDGRVLLSRFRYIRKRVEEFVVCDPLHRRYAIIPLIPDDLLDSAAGDGTARYLLPVLAPAGENDKEESFRVVSTVLFKDKVMAFVFSSCDQTWQGILSTISLPDTSIKDVTYYAHGCLYWMVGLKDYSLMFDTSEMKFSTIDLPPHDFEIDHRFHDYDSMRGIVEAADGRLGFLSIGDGTIDLYCKNSRSNCVGAQEWLHDKLIPLPKDSGIINHWAIEGTAGCYVALVAYHGPNSIPDRFVLDIKTLLVENLCTSQHGAFSGFPYARFPPPLALPSIRNDDEEEAQD